MSSQQWWGHAIGPVLSASRAGSISLDLCREVCCLHVAEKATETQNPTALSQATGSLLNSTALASWPVTSVLLTLPLPSGLGMGLTSPLRLPSLHAPWPPKTYPVSL